MQLNLPSEIAPIADAVDRLIARLRQALEAERSFTGNSAHELRTPIAAALAQTQRLLAEMPDNAIRERARTVELALRELSRLSEKLLQLAKAEGGGLLVETPQNLAEVLRFVFGGSQRKFCNRQTSCRRSAAFRSRALRTWMRTLLRS